MIASKLATKARTTIPLPVRAVLRLKQGDALAYEFEGDRGIFTRASAGSIIDPFATLAMYKAFLRNRETQKINPIAISRLIQIPASYLAAPCAGTIGESQSYQCSAAKHFLAGSSRPTLVPHALDDPWIRAACYTAIVVAPDDDRGGAPGAAGISDPRPRQPRPVT